MTVSLPDLVGKVRIDDSALDKTLSTTQSKLSSFGAGLSKVGLGLTAGLTAPLIGFGAMAVKEAGEARQALAQTEAVIKSTGGAANVTVPQISALSDRLGKMAGVEGEVVQAGANMLLTFTNVRNEAGRGNDVFNQATATLADMSTALGTDMKTSAIQLGKALNDPIKGVTALSRVGVTFTDQQKAQIKTLVESGNVMGAQKIILAELNKEFGGSAKAAGDSLPPMERLKLTMADLGESVGTILIPFLDKAAQFIGTLADKFNDLSPAAQQIVVVVGGIAAALGPVLFIVGKLLTVLPAVGTAFGVMTGPIGLVVAGIGALVAALIYAWNNSETFRQIVTTAFEAIRTTVLGHMEAIRAWFVTVWPQIQEAITHVLGVIQAAWRLWGDDLLTLARGAWTAISGVIGGAIKVIQGVLQTVLAIINGDWSRAWDGMKMIVQGVWQAIRGIVEGAIGALRGVIGAGWDAVRNQTSGVWNSVKSTVANAVNGMSERVGAVMRAIGGAFNAVIGPIRTFISWVQKAISVVSSFRVPSALQRHSPSEFEVAVGAAAEGFKRLQSTMQSGLPKVGVPRLGITEPAFAGAAGGRAGAASPSHSTVLNNPVFNLRTIWDPKDPMSKRGVMTEIRDYLVGLETAGR